MPVPDLKPTPGKKLLVLVDRLLRKSLTCTDGYHSARGNTRPEAERLVGACPGQR